MKKGQVIGQVFVYILAVILTVLILTYGYKAIVSFRVRSDQVSIITFKNDLKGAVETITSDFGSTKIISLSFPPNFRKVCFVKTIKEDGIPETLSDTGYPIIEDSVNDGAEKNVFLVENIAKESFYVGKIDVLNPDKPNLLCVKSVGGRIRIKLTGMGDHTEISNLNA